MPDNAFWHTPDGATPPGATTLPARTCRYRQPAFQVMAINGLIDLTLYPLLITPLRGIRFTLVSV